MSTVQALDKQISSYLVQLSLPQKKAVLSVIKAFAADDVDDSDKEIQKRIAEYESRAVKGYTFEESAERARQAYQKF